MSFAESQYECYSTDADRIQLLRGGSGEYAAEAEKVGNNYILVIKESGNPCDMAADRQTLKSRIASPELYEILTVRQFRKKYLLGNP